MTARRRYLFVLLFVLGLIGVSAWIVLDKPTRLGLDLRGGVELVYQGRPTPQQPEVTTEAMERSIEIIRQRIDRLGVAEPEVSRLGTTEITVSLPDVENAERAIDRVGQTSQLYFYDWEPNVITRPDTPRAEPGGSPQTPFEDLYTAVRVASQQEPACEDCTVGPRWYMFTDDAEHELIAGPGTELRDDILTDDQGDPRPPSAGEILKVPQGTLVLRGTPDADPACLTDDCYWVIEDAPSLTGTDLRDPAQNFDPQSNQPNVTFEFNDEGREAFHEVTRRIAQRGQDQAVGPVDAQTAAGMSGHFAVVLDNEVVSRPIINFVENPDGIDGRTGAQISGDFTIQEAQDLATFLQIGALPINLELISQTQVSATLGQQALDEGLRAGILGFTLVILFLLLFYRFLGALAVTALLGYGVIFFAMIKLIPITLTLPGIAGLILTIGVAADSNIVIFERIKEEVRAGRAIPTAISVGYRKGITTILDANVVTLLTAFILFVMATAGVKGFAFTLGIGILVSLLTAVVFTQALLGSMGNAAFLRRPGVLGAGKRRFPWRVDFTGLSRWLFSASGVILVIGAFSFAILGFNFGIDFQSGSRVAVALEQPAEERDIRAAIQQVGLQENGIQRVTDPELGANAFQFQTTNEDLAEQAGQDEEAAAAEQSEPAEATGGDASPGAGGERGAPGTGGDPAQGAGGDRAPPEPGGESARGAGGDRSQGAGGDRPPAAADAEEASEAAAQEISELEDLLDERYGIVEDAFNVTTIGPTFGAQVAQSAVIAVILALILISAFVAIRFQPKFAIPVLIAIVHDILITGGVYSLLGREMTTATVAALLTIQGYSLYDTIIVFDRIRENVPRMPRAPFSQIANRSMNEIVVRSLATSLSTLTAVVAIFFFGGETLRDFALAIMIGVVSGTYSSLFIAAPVLAAWKEREPAFQRRRIAILDKIGYVPAFEEDVDIESLEQIEQPRRAPAPSRATLSPGDEQPQAGEGHLEPGEEQVEPGVVPDPGSEPSGAGGDETGADRQPTSKPAGARKEKRRNKRQSRRKHGRNR